MPGEGPINASVMLIGEGPGGEEDRTGRPFVGRAGKLLDGALKSIGTSRKDVFITNVVKCRPPKNRVPTRSERETCKNAYLMNQVDLIKPSLIILLGRTATQTMLEENTLNKVRGRIIIHSGTKYLCTYHPAAVLRNPHLKGTLSRDLRKAVKENT